MHKILEEAVAVGNATARAIWIHCRDKEAYFFKESAGYTGFVGGNHEFLKAKMASKWTVQKPAS
jgi:hypothetical protein